MDQSSVYHVLDSTIRRNKVVLEKKKRKTKQLGSKAQAKHAVFAKNFCFVLNRHSHNKH